MRINFEKGELLPFLLLMPTILIVVIVMIIPLGYGFVVSLFDYDIGNSLLGSDFVGLGNYIRAIKDQTVWISLRNTLLFAIFATAGDLIIGTLISVVLLNLSTRLGRTLRAIYTMPLLISPIIVGLIWRYIYDPMSGILYWILGIFGLGIEEFPGVTDSSTALFSVIVAHWWQVTPFVIIIISAGLVSIPSSYYEAAEMDGAGYIAKFFKISLPLLAKVYMVILIISGVDTIKVFDIIYALTQGGPANSTMSISIYAYKNAFEMYRMGYAMAISILAMVASFLMFAIPFIRFNRREEAS